MKQFSNVSLSLRPSRRKICHRIKNGWVKRPVNTSLTAKQDSKMLLLVRSRGVVFTAFITSTFSTTVKGQLMVLMMIDETATDGTSPESPSILAMFVTLIKLTKEKFTLSNWKPNANQVCISKQQSLLVIQS